jgi:hypothetical protein
MNLAALKRFVLLLLLAVSGAAHAETVWFEVAEIETERDQSFLVALSDPEHIAHARALIANGGRPSDDLGGILLADIRAGGDGFNRDIRDPRQRLWRWHISRVEGFGGLAIELCDGWPGFVEEDPEAFITNTNGVICFWGYTIKSELVAAPKFAVSEGLDGGWYNPDTAGQGIYVDALAEEGLLALAWFTWTQGAPGASRAGEQLWFSGLGEIAGNASDLELYASSGGVFNAQRSVQTGPIGNAVLSFQNCDSGLLRYEFDSGETGEIPLRRVVPRPGCVR